MISILDFLPRNPAATVQKPLLHWLIRRIEVRIHHAMHVASPRYTLTYISIGGTWQTVNAC